MKIPALARYHINHRRTHQPGDRDNKYGIRCMSGVVVDTNLRAPVANFRYDPKTRELCYFKRTTAEPLSISQILQAVRKHYSSGFFTKKPKGRQKPNAAPWTPETAPRPLPAPRIARMA